MKIKDMNVLITGGASGIGKIMGRMALEKGAKSLIIWDVNQEALEATVAEFSARGCAHNRVYIYKVDITNSELVAQTYQQIKQEVGPVDILINCAGIVRGNKTFDQQTVQDIRLTFEVNTIAPMVIAQQILPDMIRRNRGHVCNIASAGGGKTSGAGTNGHPAALFPRTNSGTGRKSHVCQSGAGIKN